LLPAAAAGEMKRKEKRADFIDIFNLVSSTWRYEDEAQTVETEDDGW
jgi:hypothetical protein